MTILIVDDDVDTLNLCRMLLAPFECEVLTAGNVLQALETVRARPIDLLIVDIVMPRRGGFDLMRYLKETGEFRGKILMLTGRRALEDVLTALDLGAVDYVCKPFEREVFLKKVQSILEIRKREPQGGGMSRSATDDEIVVEVAADLREIVPTFLENRRKDIRVIGEAIERGDLGAIRVIGHRLQGTGGGYGFPRLAEIGDSLEKGAEAGDTGALRALLAEMAEFVAKVRVVYRERDP